MSRVRPLPVAALAAAGSLLWTGSAQAAAHKPPAHAPKRTPAPAPAPATPPPIASGAPGSLRLVAQRVLGNSAFVLVGGRFVIQGVVWPYVGGQQVKVSLYRDGRKIAVKRLAVVAVGNGSGAFRFSYASSRAGVVQARVVHYATPVQAQFTARTRRIHFVSPNLRGGARGGSVQVLQSELNALHYVVPLNGVFDEATGRAVVAYRKLAGLQRVGSTNTHFFVLLGRGAGSFHVRYRGDGRHVEADLTRQVLAEINPGGRVRAIYTMSSGKPSTPTVVGRFRVYSKTPGTNSHGMVDSNYFIAGYAIHGYAEVPTYAASHGCLRVPIPNAASIYGWVQLGTPVDVYHEGGGGSHHVNKRAGP
jgi:lipoprotein-anchoring transpeptidase ErfK/SrfK